MLLAASCPFFLLPKADKRSTPYIHNGRLERFCLTKFKEAKRGQQLKYKPCGAFAHYQQLANLAIND
jgi:hypothetical protein